MPENVLGEGKLTTSETDCGLLNVQLRGCPFLEDLLDPSSRFFSNPTNPPACMLKIPNYPV